MGKWPMGVELSIKKKVYILKGRIRKLRKEGIVSTMLKKAKNLVQRPKDKIYSYTTTFQASNENLPILKNSLGDLLQYEAEGSWMTRWEFLADAMHRFEVGQQSYSYCENGRLLCNVWLNQEELKKAAHTPTANPTLLERFYFHPIAENKLKNFILSVTGVITQESPKSDIHVHTSSNEKRICQTLEALGFQIAGR